MIRIVETTVKIVPFVLCAMGLGACCLCGCSKEKDKETPLPPNSPAVYMKDTNFLHQVEAKKKELQAILKERKPLADRMQQLVKEHGEDLAALQKIDEWNELHKKVVALNKKYEEVRARQLKIVRARIAPQARSGETPLPLCKGDKSGEKKEISK